MSNGQEHTHPVVPLEVTTPGAYYAEDADEAARSEEVPSYWHVPEDVATDEEYRRKGFQEDGGYDVLRYARDPDNMMDMSQERIDAVLRSANEATDSADALAPRVVQGSVEGAEYPAREYGQVFSFDAGLRGLDADNQSQTKNTSVQFDTDAGERYVVSLVSEPESEARYLVQGSRTVGGVEVALPERLIDADALEHVIAVEGHPLQARHVDNEDPFRSEGNVTHMVGYDFTREGAQHRAAANLPFVAPIKNGAEDMQAFVDKHLDSNELITDAEPDDDEPAAATPPKAPAPAAEQSDPVVEAPQVADPTPDIPPITPDTPAAAPDTDTSSKPDDGDDDPAVVDPPVPATKPDVHQASEPYRLAREKDVATDGAKDAETGTITRRFKDGTYAEFSDKNGATYAIESLPGYEQTGTGESIIQTDRTTYMIRNGMIVDLNASKEAGQLMGIAIADHAGGIAEIIKDGKWKLTPDSTDETIVGVWQSREGSVVEADERMQLADLKINSPFTQAERDFRAVDDAARQAERQQVAKDAQTYELPDYFKAENDSSSSMSRAEITAMFNERHPINAVKSFYLEDAFIRQDISRGTAETASAFRHALTTAIDERMKIFSAKQLDEKMIARLEAARDKGLDRMLENNQELTRRLEDLQMSDPTDRGVLGHKREALLQDMKPEHIMVAADGESPPFYLTAHQQQPIAANFSFEYTGYDSFVHFGSDSYMQRTVQGGEGIVLDKQIFLNPNQHDVAIFTEIIDRANAAGLDFTATIVDRSFEDVHKINTDLDIDGAIPRRTDGITLTAGKDIDALNQIMLDVRNQYKAEFDKQPHVGLTHVPVENDGSAMQMQGVGYGEIIDSDERYVGKRLRANKYIDERMRAIAQARREVIDELGISREDLLAITSVQPDTKLDKRFSGFLYENYIQSGINPSHPAFKDRARIVR